MGTNHQRVVLLLGTDFGARLSVAVDGRSENDDQFTLLCDAPHGERIGGICVE